MIVDNPNPFSWDNSLWQTLLTDRTLNQPIQWATTSYEALGQGYQPTNPLLNDNVGMTDLLTVVLPRASKTDSQRKQRAQSDGEVFTPSWLCNHQNNAIDALWFQTDSPFTTEKEKDWETVQSPILWQRPNDWHDYVLADRCEITCGEAPYLVSRYDSVTGKPIPIANRIGILDRKLRVINEQHLTYDEWQAWVESAYQHTYGFDKQGDSLAIARTNLLLTYLECHDAVWHRYPSNESLHRIAEIISWNIWQMDGLTLTIPNTEISPTIKHWDDASSQSFTDDTLTYPLFDSVVGNPPYQQLDGGVKSVPSRFTRNLSNTLPIGRDTLPVSSCLLAGIRVARG